MTDKGLSKYHKRKIEYVKNRVAKAVTDFNLISENDRVLLAISGGKDSLCLLENLASFKKYGRIKFHIEGINIALDDMDYKIDNEKIKAFADLHNIDLKIVNTSAGIEKRGSKSACFICSRHRRKIMFEYAVKNGFTKIAFGHHLDDAVETLLINMAYHANAASMPPLLELFDGEIKIIRPLILLTNKDTSEIAAIQNYPKLKKTCQFDDKTMRTTARDVVNKMQEIHPDMRMNLIKSFYNIDEKLIMNPNAKNII